MTWPAIRVHLPFASTTFKSIQQAIEDNAGAPNPVRVFRLAPLAGALQIGPDGKPGDGRSISTFDFNGAWTGDQQLVMNLYDWFMQGYLDAMDMAPGTADKDAIFADYMNPACRVQGMSRTLDGRPNDIWDALVELMPSDPP